MPWQCHPDRFDRASSGTAFADSIRKHPGVTKMIRFIHLTATTSTLKTAARVFFTALAGLTLSLTTFAKQSTLDDGFIIEEACRLEDAIIEAK